MLRRGIAILLLAAGMLCLSGCARLFVTEYRSAAPYTDPQTEPEASGTEIRTYSDLKRVLRGMVADYVDRGTLVFADYDGIIADDLSNACWELRSSTALGAYCLQDITYEIEQVVAYCEADVVITYKRSADEVKSIWNAQNRAAVQGYITEAVESDRRVFAIMTSVNSITEADIQDMVESQILSHPLVSVSIPDAEITMFTGSTPQRIFEVRLSYPISDAECAARRTELAAAVQKLANQIHGEGAERVAAACDAVGRSVERAGAGDSTAYDVLVAHQGDSRATAMALKAVCDALEIPCEIVDGQLGSYFHTWNIVEIDGERYHVDLTGYAGTLWFQPDAVVWGRYWWNTEAHAPCTAEGIVWSGSAE